MNLNAKVPMWKLERYLLGELPHAELQAIDTALNNDPQLAKALEELRIQNVQFAQEFDPQASAQRALAQVSARKQQSKSASILEWIWKPAGVLATLAIAVLVGVEHYSHKPLADSVQVAQANTTLEETRTKGLENRIEVWQKSGDTTSKLLDSAKVQKGDLLQIRSQVAKRCFAAIVSLDGRGNWTTHLPDTGTAAVALEPGLSGFLPFAYQLDDAPRYEVFWLITSAKPFAVNRLIQTLAPLQGSPIPPPFLPLDSKFEQSRLVVFK